MKLKSLDKYFLILSLGIFTFILVAGYFVQVSLSKLMLEEVIGQLQVSSSINTSALSKELLAGNHRYAWKQISRTLRNHGLIAFALLDSSNKWLVDDIEMIDRISSIKDRYNWYSYDTEKSVLVRDDLNYVVVTSSVNQQYNIAYYYETNAVHDSIKTVRKAILCIALVLIAGSFAVFIFLRRAFSYSLQSIGDGVETILTNRVLKDHEKRLINEYFQTKNFLTDFRLKYEHYRQEAIDSTTYRAIAHTVQTIAHDLKSPINVINQTLNSNNWLEFLQRKPVTTSAMLRLQGMVDSFKNADLEGVVKNNWGTISWDGIVNEMRSLAAEKGVLLHLEDVYRGSVYLDIPKIERVVINLLKNAIEAGSKNIWLSGRANGMDLAIKVSDDGSGVPEEFVPYLFTKGKTLNKVDGTGLGLSFVRQTANGHGGEATYERIDNRSIFGITLPKVVKDEKDEKDAADGEQGMFKIELTQLAGEPVKDEETFIGVQKKEIFSKVTVSLGNEQLELKVIEALAKQYPTVKFGDSLEGSSFVWTNDHELIKDAITKKIPIHMLSDKETPEALVKTISNKLQYFT